MNVLLEATNWAFVVLSGIERDHRCLGRHHGVQGFQMWAVILHAVQKTLPWPGFEPRSSMWQATIVPHNQQAGCLWRKKGRGLKPGRQGSDRWVWLLLTRCGRYTGWGQSLNGVHQDTKSQPYKKTSRYTWYAHTHFPYGVTYIKRWNTFLPAFSSGNTV